MKKKSFTKRIIAVVLSLIMVLGLLPVVVFADNTACTNGNHEFNELGKCGCGVQAEASVTQISLETDYDPVFYLKLADAVTACNNSEMGSMRLKLLDDVTVSVPSGDDACITLTKYTSLDLNGHSVTTYDDVLCVILFCHNGMIWDTSADKTGRISGGTYAFKTDGGWVYIRGGTFESWISTAGGGKTYIDGGTYNGEIFFANSECEFELNAGTFTKGILINGSCGTRNVFDLLGEGKAYQVNGRLYDSADAENLETPREFFKYNEVKVVTAADVAVAEVDGIKYTSLSAAIAAADLDTTITLLKDTDEDITVSKAVNIDFGGKKASGVFTFDGGSITVIGAFESGTKLKVKKNSYTTKVEWGTVVIWDQSDFLTNDDIQPVDAGAEIKSYGKSHALVHPHGWDHKVSDTQDGKLIEIYCKYLETCPYADYSDALGAWLELCSDELTYNGWTREARLSRYINAYLYTDSLPDSSDIVYYDENGKDLDGKPKNAGNYTASLTFVNADGTDVVATVDFIILPKKLTEDMITVEPSTEEYDGNAVTPVVTVKDGNTALIEGTDYVVSGDVSGTDVSTYTILVTGKGNYCDTVNISWNIAKADMDFISADNVEVTYDGNAYSVEVKGAPEDAEILYSTDGGNTYVAEKPTFTNVADSGTVYYKVTHKNYNEYSGAATITIQPKTITVTAEEKETIVNTALPTYTYRVEGLIGDDKLVTEPTFTTAADIAVIGEYDITASGADAGNNYSIKYVSAKLTVLTDNTVDVAKGYGKELKDYDPNIVTSDDKAELDKILDKINTLLVDETITDNGKKALEEVKAQVQGLIQKITDAEAATATENTEKVKDLTSDNVKPENKADLEKAAEDLEKALEEHGSNMTEDEKKVVEDEIKRIDDALTVIGNVEDVEELIEKIPDIIKKEDADVIKAADDAYSTLSDYEKSLVDDDVKKTLDDAKTALAELNKPAGTTSPNTGDNSNIFLWIALLFISGGAVITLTVVDRKKRIVKK